MSLNLQRIAWAVMLGAFFTFCGVCALTVYGTYSFLFQSTVPMTAIAQASRGSIGITGADLREDVERGTRALGLNNLVRPNDQDSQGAILIQDPYNDNTFVASVTLIGDSTASLRTALRPRFNWSNPFDQGRADYVIEFARLRGDFEVTIADDLPLDLALDLYTDRTDRRVRVRLSEAGWYSIEADGNTVSVASHGGTALIYGADSSIGYSVTAGSGSIYTVDTDVIRALPREVQLLQNSQLSPSDTGEGGTPFPANWVCSSRPDVITEPRGNFSAEQLDGREVLRIIRSGTQSPAQTGCFQGLPEGQVWQDISAYEGLSIRTSFYLNYQSLPVCGIEGSECPLMIRLDYINAAGENSFLVYGFYNVPATPEQRFPQTCANCIREHIRVQEKTWYSFDSGNILAGFLADQRPVAITQLRFYAGGHEYDVRVGRMELIAENTAG